MSDAYATLRAHLAGLLARFEAADQRARAEHDPDARGDAEAAALEATGEHWEASREIADLLLLLLRHAMRHHRDVLHEFIVNLLRPQLNELADALYRLERNSRGSP
jgi:hypothetical protein